MDHSGLYHGGGIGGPFRALPWRRKRWAIQGCTMEEGKVHGPFRAVPWRRDRWTIQGFAMEKG